MPSFTLRAHTSAPVEQVWKLIHDPTRFPEWWAGIETVQLGMDPPGMDPPGIDPPGIDPPGIDPPGIDPTGMDQVSAAHAGTDGRYTIWPTGYPDFPMAQNLRSDHLDGRVTISCLVSDLEFRWQLSEALKDGDGTEIEVHVVLPDQEAHRLPQQRMLIENSIDRLARLAVDGRPTGS